MYKSIKLRENPNQAKRKECGVSAKKSRQKKEGKTRLFKVIRSVNESKIQKTKKTINNDDRVT
jgi:hypothetical protein